MGADVRHGSVGRQKNNTHITHIARHTVTEQVSRMSCDKDTIESGEREEKEDHVHSWLVSVQCEAQLISPGSWGCQTITSNSFLWERNRGRETQISPHRKHLGTLSLFLSLLSHASTSISVPFQSSSPSLIKLLIRNYAIDPKTERERAQVCVCASVGVALHVFALCRARPKKKIQPCREKLFKRLQPSSSLSLEEDKDQRLVVLEAAWEKV